jgi:ethanolamine ammonia-lyase small subunit
MANLIRSSGFNLRDYTPARVSLPTTGHSITTGEVLSFQLAHAQARDAVHAQLNLASFGERLRAELPVTAEAGISVMQLETMATDRTSYLRRPDLGRSLHPDSVARLRAGSYDLAIVVADGLSALAIERHAIPLLHELLPLLLSAGWTMGPLALVRHGRVAIGDAIGSLIGASLSLVLIGERPGLSSPASLGAYITWGPRADRTDADRNCVSNIGAGGLSPDAATSKIFWYLQEGRARRITGVSLKDGSLDLP